MEPPVCQSLSATEGQVSDDPSKTTQSPGLDDSRIAMRMRSSDEGDDDDAMAHPTGLS